VAVAAVWLALASTVSAHVTAISGAFRVRIGWGHEPAIAGSENFVQVTVANNRSGGPILNATLAVQVSYGDARMSLPLLPAGGQLGEYDAVIVPTEAGTYGLHVSGTVNGSPIEVAATCSERTFDCVTPVSEVQFPVRTPSGAELGQGLARALLRAQRASDSASTARTIGIAAIALAVLALAGGVGLGLRGGRAR
jgi:hypothetical protein